MTHPDIVVVHPLSYAVAAALNDAAATALRLLNACRTHRGTLSSFTAFTRPSTPAISSICVRFPFVTETHRRLPSNALDSLVNLAPRLSLRHVVRCIVVSSPLLEAVALAALEPAHTRTCALRYHRLRSETISRSRDDRVVVGFRRAQRTRSLRSRPVFPSCLRSSTSFRGLVPNPNPRAHARSYRRVSTPASPTSPSPPPFQISGCLLQPLPASSCRVRPPS